MLKYSTLKVYDSW